MNTVRLMLVAIVCLAAALIAALPARFAFDLFARPAGVEADLVTGTIWNARLYRVALGGQSFAEADARMALWPLFAGRAVIDVEARDATASASARVRLTPGSLEIRNARAVAQVRRLPGLADLAGLPDEPVALSIDQIRFRAGTCVVASGDASTAVLRRLGMRYAIDLPALTGRLACAGEAVTLVFDGASPVLDLRGSIRLSAPGYRWTVEAQTDVQDAVPVLIALGFEERTGRWHAEGEGLYP